jgi:hypothetical protein
VLAVDGWPANQDGSQQQSNTRRRLRLAGGKDDDGWGAGGFVIEGSTAGANPVYHPDIFGKPSNAFAPSHARPSPDHGHRKSPRLSAPAGPSSRTPARRAILMANIDRDFRKYAQALLLVDKTIGDLQAAVALRN